MDRWHPNQSDAVRRINECAMVMAFERCGWEEGSSLIGFVGRNISSHRMIT